MWLVAHAIEKSFVGVPFAKHKVMEKMNRVVVVLLVGSLLAAAAIWGGAEAMAPGLVQFVYIGFLALFGGALAAGVRKAGHGRQIVHRRKGDSP